MKWTDLLQDAANLYFKFIPQTQPLKQQALKTKIVAHRGAWNNKDRLENTMAAFDKALESRVWAIEFDIRWTKDNIPVVHHDPSTQRVFKKDLIIEDTTFSQLKSENPLIPSLEEMIIRYAHKIHFMIEIKEPLTPKQDQILFDLLKPLKEIRDYHFMYLQLEYFNTLTSFDPKSFVAIGRGDLKSIHEKSLNMNVGALTGHYLLFNNTMKKMQHNLMRQTGVGFPTSKNGLYREIHRGFDWVFTNKACELQKTLNQLILSD